MRVTEKNRAEWEALCRRCGQCCFEKMIDENGRVHPTRVPCRFLDIHTRHCRIYHQRTTVESDCRLLTPESVPTFDWLPEDCAYVEFMRGKS